MPTTGELSPKDRDDLDHFIAEFVYRVIKKKIPWNSASLNVLIKTAIKEWETRHTDR